MERFHRELRVKMEIYCVYRIVYCQFYLQYVYIGIVSAKRDLTHVFSRFIDILEV